jgi:hypothetical protein
MATKAPSFKRSGQGIRKPRQYIVNHASQAYVNHEAKEGSITFD